MLDRRTVLSLPVAAALAGGLVAGSPVTDRTAAATPQAPPGSDLPMQSPVDIVTSDVVRQPGLPRLGFHYSRSTPVSVRYVSRDDDTADGCSVRGDQETEEVDVRPGAGQVRLSGVRYDLVQFHFHTPSEHTVDGRHAPLELHLVHQAEDQRRLVVAILLLPGAPGEADRILRRLPEECGEEIEVEDFDLRALLPHRRATLRYLGSLTTAPYTEDTKWFITVPQTVSAEGIASFQALFPDGDSRPTQPLNGRRLVADRHW